MKFKDIDLVGETYHLEASAAGSKQPVSKGSVVNIVETRTGSYVLSIESSKEPGKYCIFNLKTDNDTRKTLDKMTNVVDKGIYLLEAIKSKGKTDVVKIVIKKLPLKSITKNLKFVISQEFKDKLVARGEVSEYVPGSVKKYIEQNFFIPQLNSLCAVVGINTRAINSSNRKGTMVIKGKDGYIVVDEVQLSSGESVLSMTKKIQRIPPVAYDMFLINDVEVVDKTVDGILRKQVKDMLEMDNQNYLKDWKRYGELEEERTYNSLKRAGILHFESSEVLKSGEIKFIIQEDKRISAEEAIKKFTEEASEAIAVDVYDNTLLKIDSEFEPRNYKKKRSSLNPISLNFCKAEPKKSMVILKYSSDSQVDQIPNKGSIMLNIIGDCSRYERRNDAIKILEAGESGIPHLITLLEGESLGTSLKTRPYEALTPELREELFPNGATDNQIKAIETALSTPDVALIQGPPGTGKTTVIVAIIQRLMQIDAGEEKFWGENLITSYQHDAVDNAVERIHTNGLPAMKCGNRFSQNGDDRAELKKNIEGWIEEQKDKLLDKYSDLNKTQELLNYEKFYEEFMVGINSIDSTLKILEKAESIFEKYNFTDLVIECEELCSNLKYKSGISSVDKYLMQILYNIPTCDAHMSDDGQKWLYKGYLKLKDSSRLSIQDAAEKLYKAYKTKREDMDEEYYKDLKELKGNLILKFLPVNPLFINGKKHESVVQILDKGMAKIQEYAKKNFSPNEKVAAKLYDELEDNPYYIQEELKKYMEVIGATCQQAVSQGIMFLKGEKASYKNVIIDEAARANPLDLLIPASKAMDRIILVGDHRQLPHIVEEDLLDQIESEKIKDKQEIENLEESMFERLYMKLKKLEQTDGIRRVVTLDTQFRMHPVLGEFVSENFYEKTDGVKVKSIRKAQEFVHNVPGLENKACVWLDVPYERGREMSGKSKSRKIEAEQIAKHIKSVIDNPETKNLTFGVITFYKKQVELVMEALSKYGITQKTQGGNYIIKEEYRFVKGKEKLLVGTVDAFQGKEFDVVYLSVVRSNKKNSLNSRYGHLRVPNRLCVSMSRQKKLLIVVGDSQMFTGEMAGNIESLTNFYQMCKEDTDYGKILDFME